MKENRMIDALEKVKEEYIMEAAPLNTLEKSDVSDTSVAEKQKRTFGRKKWIVLLAAAILAIGVLSVGAANDFKWFRSVERELHVDEDAKAVYEKYAMNHVVGQSVEQNGVTVTVEGYIADRHILYVILSIDGVKEPRHGSELHFSKTALTVAGNYGSAGIYLGKNKETGKLLYRLTCDYFHHQNDIAGSYYFEEHDITGSVVHLKLEGIEELTSVEKVAETGIAYGDSQINASYDGVFEFEWEVENTAPTWKYDVDHIEVANQNVDVKSITMSPLSVTVKAEYTDAVKDELIIQSGFVGFKMKDGSLIQSVLLDTEDALGSNVVIDGFKHTEIVDLDQVEALLFVDPFGEYAFMDIEQYDAYVEIPISELQ